VIPACEPWSLMEKLHKEKEVIGMYLSGHPLDDFKLEFKTFVNAELSKVEEIRNKEVSIAGVVTDSYEKMSKAGKPYGGFTLEDYSGNLRITMWSEDYLKYRHLLSQGQMLFIKGTMKLRYGSTDQYEFKVNHIMLLAEAREKLLTKVTFTIRTNLLVNGFVEQFKQLLDEYKGTATVKVNIIDPAQQLAVSSLATKNRISFENDFIQKLNVLNIEWKIN
jgi:DNA polymerase-3 subunit alpha